MNSFMKVLVGGCSILALGACARTNGQKAADEANQKIQQVQTEIDAARKAAEDAGKAGDAASKSATDAYEQALDNTASGSQPGQISLYGALAEGAKPMAQLVITQGAGQGWRGTYPELATDRLVLKPADTIAFPVAAGDVVNYGCDLEKYPEAKKLSLRTIEPKDAHLTVAAEMVLICDGKQLGEDSILVHAQKIILANAKIQARGIEGLVNINLSANELTLEGESKISSLSADGSSTIFSGPQIWLSAKSLKGDGKLEIESKGSSYVEKKTETPAAAQAAVATETQE